MKKITPKFIKSLPTLFATTLLCATLAGCQQSGANGDFGGVGGGERETQVSGQPAMSGEEEAQSMGRYVEKQIELDEALSGKSNIVTYGDKITISNYWSKIYESEDNGESWSSVDLEWFDALSDLNYVMEMACSADGTFAVQYAPYSERELAIKNGTADETQADLNNEEETQNTPLDAHLMIISPDGEQKELDAHFSSDDVFARSLWFTDDGRLLMTTVGKNVYEVDTESGVFNKICTLESSVLYVRSQGNLLLLPTYDGVFLYDMESKQFVEDEALDGFIKDTYKTPTDYGSCYNLYAFFGEENVLYIAGTKGLHRHVIGGSAIEQVVDPSISSFGMPSRGIVTAVMIDNQEFLAQFEDETLMKFYYDATVLTVPNNKLVVYSLENKDTVKQAISAYQTAHTDMFVVYEVALEDDGVTREDALKNLSTRLMNGEGPDVLILDDMPIDSYTEKEILLDISDVITEVKSGDGLYENLFAPFYEDDCIYVAPVEFQIPVVVSDSKSIAGATDYKGYAQTIQNLRAQNPEGMIIKDCNEKGITKKYIPMCAPAWKNEDGSLKEDTIREFLEQTKIIYDAQMSGVPQKDVSTYNNMNIWESKAHDFDYEFYWRTIDTSSMMMRGTKIDIGNIHASYEFADAFSTPRQKGLEDYVIDLFDGQGENLYLPGTLTGVNAQSKNVEASKDFVRTLLSEEIQTDAFAGLPVNKKALENVLVKLDGTEDPDGDGIYAMYGGSDEEGNSYFWNVYCLDDAQKQTVRDWVSQAKMPYIRDNVLEDAVENACTKYLLERRTLEEALDEIRESTAIYMAE